MKGKVAVGERRLRLFVGTKSSDVSLPPSFSEFGIKVTLAQEVANSDRLRIEVVGLTFLDTSPQQTVPESP